MATVPVGGGVGDDRVPIGGRPPVDVDAPHFRAVLHVADSVRRYLPMYAVLAVFAVVMAKALGAVIRRGASDDPVGGVEA
ncbi:MAG TPA: hypothetical protein VM262_17700 [Acidimicrobiales bacterium]|nr:hypothetical protein [Acidimicrobiales bacterium]